MTESIVLTSSSSITKMESTLLQTLTDCHVRNEVEVCMNSILLDVETAYHLRQQLQLHANQLRVDKLTREQKAMVLEADSERSAREEQRLELADDMVQELMTLSRELETLVQWKKEHEYKVEHFDELTAKLAQTEEELQDANRVSYGGGPKPRRPNEVVASESEDTAEETSDAKDQSSPKVASDRTEIQEPDPKEQTPEKLTAQDTPAYDLPPNIGEDTKPATEEEDKKPPAETVTTEVQPTETIVDIPTESSLIVVDIPETADAGATADTSDTLTMEPPIEPAAAAVVSLDDDEPEEEVPGLVEIDMEILMHVFGFMSAIDILNSAQINLAMYSRVDNIFGISEDGQSPPKPPRPPAKKKPPASVVPAVKPPAPVVPAVKPAAATAPIVDRKPFVAAAAESGPMGKGLFSMLQPSRPVAPAPVKASGQKRVETSGRGPALNASVAQSMASKLSDAELAAIISMTDKLSKMEREVILLRNEKEALSAKLDGTEAVKQFLIGKVRDVELKLNQSRDDEIKVTQQISSDQEVIAFLDSRVQDLESSTDSLTTESVTTQSEFQSLKVSSSKKITMLSDMLKYEREKLKDEECEWKATKKVLVKEVKSCRAQILALQAERDGFKEQNEMLKRAIVSTGKNSASSPSR